MGRVDLLLTAPGQHAGNALVQPENLVAKGLLDRYLLGPVWANTVVEAASLVDAERAGIESVTDALAWLLLLTRYSLSIDPFGDLRDYDRPRAALSSVSLVGPTRVKSMTSSHQWLRDSDWGLSTPPFTPSTAGRLGRLCGSLPSDDHLRQAVVLWFGATRASNPYERITLLWRALELCAISSGRGQTLFDHDALERLRSEAPTWLNPDQQSRYRGWASQLNETPLMPRRLGAAQLHRVPLEEADVGVLRRVRKVRNAMEHGHPPSAPYLADIDRAVALLGRILVFWGAR